ncbi:MAG: nuclear transport factor 2 family protein [Pyrinomonadaceae bacterium]
MKKQLPFAVVLILILASLALAQEATPGPSPAPKPAMTRAQSQRIIIATERKLWEGWKKGDMKPFNSYLSADSVMIGDGGVSNKATSIKEMSNMKCDVKSYELSDIKVTFLDSNAALITYKATQDAICGGQAVPAAVWASSAFVKRGGKWYAASHQETVAK